MKRLLITLLIVTSIGMIASCGTKGHEEVTLVRLMLDWVPNTNHTGIYVAEAKGYFDDEGLAVEIVQPGDVYAEAAVAGEAADFGISFQEQVTLARAEDVPIVSIAAVLQHNTSGFASLSELGIESPKDFEGKRYGAFGSPFEHPTLEVLMDCSGADVEKLKIIDTGWADTLALMVENQIDLAWIYYGWEGFQARQQGLDLNVVMMEDYFNCIPDYYTPVVITNESTIADNPELIESFMKALSRGYEFAADNPDEAAGILVTAVPELDAELAEASQQWISRYYTADTKRWGEQKDSVWQDYTDWMVENGVLTSPIDVSAAFTNKFLP
ncbi:MAG: ABC transporter substrate-binding protein [Dehalococcoidales bacterium]|nr:ABC transporter substrate-binding protein [Dehalococcoidales bacterium]